MQEIVRLGLPHYGSTEEGAPRHTWGDYSKNSAGDWIKTNDTREVSISYKKLSDVISELQAVAIKINDPNAFITISKRAIEEDPLTSITISGSRFATIEEIVWIKKEIETAKKYAKHFEENEIANFKKEHPDLLK